jgi:hypothetical protein
VDADKEIAKLETQVANLNEDIKENKSIREAQMHANSMEMAKQKFMLDRDQAISKVQNMTQIQNILVKSLQEAYIELVK